MEIVKIVFTGVIELIIAVIMIQAFTPVLKELNQPFLIPVMWIAVIVGAFALFVKIYQEAV